MLMLIRFMETDGQDAYINPWFWVLCLFIGPMIASICAQWYIFMSTRALVRTEALLIQLVFEHSLRIRFKAEASKDGPSASSVSTPETQSVEGSTTIEGSDTQSNNTSNSTKGKAKADDSTTEPAGNNEKIEKKKDNLTGRINTLVTVDLDNIVSGKDFLMVGEL